MFEDFAVVAAIAPHDTSGKVVWDSELLFARVAELTYKDIMDNDFLPELFSDAPEEPEEYVNYVRRATAEAVRELFIDDIYDEETTIESFGGGKEVVMVLGDPLIDSLDGALLHVALLRELKLFDEPFEVETE